MLLAPSNPRCGGSGAAFHLKLLSCKLPSLVKPARGGEALTGIAQVLESSKPPHQQHMGRTFRKKLNANVNTDHVSKMFIDMYLNTSSHYSIIKLSYGSFRLWQHLIIVCEKSWSGEKREAFQQILNQSASVALIQTQTGLRMPVSAVKVLRCVRPPPSPTSSL